MKNREAVRWLKLCKSKGVQFDDDSPEIQHIREAATKNIMEAYDLAIKVIMEKERGSE